MASNVDSMSSPDKENESQEGIIVAIRMRPLNKTEGDKQRIWKVLPKYNSVTQTTSTGKPLSERITGRTFFTFDKVFGEDADTTQVYDSVVKGIVSSVVSGLNGTIFAYGQTSSGKTYTMQGSGTIQEGATSAGGIVHMAAKDIFAHIQSQPNRMFLVRASFLEIYNEEVRDLLCNNNQTLQIREDPRRGVFVQCQEDMVTDFESLLRILFQGEKSRAVAATGMNERSSRSHTIFRITIESREKDEQTDDDGYSSSSDDGAVRVSTLNLVDLAGSESVRHTGATGDRQKEGGMINQSLLTLSRVMVALGQANQMHINFRDSKLTRILQPSLSGNARMAVICCATPSELYLEETRSTLQFASRAKLVKTNAQVNEVLDDRSIIRRLQRELAEARGQNSLTGHGTEQLRVLENQAASAGTAAMEAKRKLDRLKASILNASYLFGGNNMTQKNKASDNKTKDENRKSHSRKRRQSDGFVPLDTRSTPLKLFGDGQSSPRTTPRKKKEKQTHQNLTPHSELTLVRQALAVRSDLSRSLKAALDKNLALLRQKEEELDHLESANDGLAEEKERAFSELVQVQKVLASVQADFDSTITEYDTLLAEKESAMVEASRRIESENSRVEELKSTNDTLTEKLNDLQQRFDALQQERVRSAFELAQSTEEREKLQAGRHQDKQSLHEMNQKIGFLTTAANEAENERKACEELILDLQQKLGAATEENEGAVEQISALETQIVAVRRDFDEERQLHRASQAEVEAQLEAVTQEKNSALARISQLEDAMGEAEQEINSAHTALEDANANHNLERTKLEDTISDIEGQLNSSMAEKCDFMNRISTLEQEIHSSEEKLTAANDMISTLQASLTGFEQNMLELHDKLQIMVSEKADLESRLDKTKEAYSLLEMELASVLERESSALSSAEEERVSNTSIIRELREQLDATAAENVETMKNYSSLEEEYCRVEAELSQSRSEHASLTLVLEKERKEYQIAVQNMQKKIEASTFENSEYLSQISSLQGEVQRLNEELLLQKGSFEATLQEAQWAREENTKVLQSYEARLAAATDELSFAETQLASLQTNVERLETQLAMAQQERAATDETINNLRDQIQETISLRDDANAQISVLQIELSSKARDLETAEASASALCATVTDLEERCHQKDAELEASLEREARVGEQFEAIQIENASLQQEVEQLIHHTTELETVLAETQETSKQQMMEYLSQNESLVSKKQQLETIIAEKEATLQYQSMQLRDAELTLNTLREEESMVKSEHAELHRELTALQSSFVSLRTQVTSKEFEKAEFIDQIGALNTELESLRSDFIALESIEASLRQKESSLLHELDSAREQLRYKDDEIETTRKETEEILAEKAREYELVNAQNERLRAELAELHSSMKLLQDRFENLDSRNTLLATENERLQELWSAIHEEKSELEKFLSASEEESTTLKDQNAALEIELSELHQSLDALQERLDESKSESLDLQESCNELKDALESARKAILENKADNKALNDLARSHDIVKIELEGRIMSLEAEKMAALAAYDSLQVSQTDKVQELEDLVAEYDEKINLLSGEKSEYARQQEEFRLKIEQLQSDVTILTQLKVDHEAKVSGLLAQLESRDHDLDTCQRNVISLQHDNSALKETIQELESQFEEIASLKHELTRVQSLHDDCERALKKSQLDLESVRVSRENALSSIRSREKERDEAVTALEELYKKNQELSASLATSVPADKRVELEKEINDLKQSNLELKQLLSSSTGSESRLRDQLSSCQSELNNKRIELEDTYYRLSQLEEELRQAELAFEEKAGLDCSEASFNNNEVHEEVRRLTLALEQERVERVTVEERLKKQMGEEQRLLIQEGERMMQSLRSRISELEKAVKESDQEAYSSRQQLAESLDRKLEAERKYAQMEVKVKELMMAVSRDEKHVSSLQIELNQARAESYVLKENAVEMNEKMRKAAADFELIQREKEVVSSELASFKRQVASVEKSKVELQKELDKMRLKIRASGENESQFGELREQHQQLKNAIIQRDETIKNLQMSLDALRQENQKLHRDIGGSDSLLDEVNQLKAKIKEKDQRIKKLQTFKLTKEFAEEHKQLKKDNKALREELLRVQQQITELNSEALSSDPSLRTEVSALRFDKEALERKLRKFAAHCQRLEDDKASMVAALRSCNMDPAKYDGDLNEAVISLCDKLSTFDQVDVSRSRRGSSDHDRLEKENEELKSKLDHLLASEEDLNGQLSRYRSETEELRKQLKAINGTKMQSTGENGETSRKLRYLEQENLQLMFDVKTTKKQLQAAREEIEVLRMNAMENSTVDFGSVDLISDSSQVTRASHGSNSAVIRPIASEKSKENVPNRSDMIKRGDRLPTDTKLAQRTNAPGLGEAAVTGDETGECNQS